MRILALILTLVGVSALGGSIGLVRGEPMYIAPELQKLHPLIAYRVLVLLTFPYSVLALLTGYAVWRRYRWATRTYALFAGFAVVLILFFLYIAPIPVDAFSLIVGPLFLALAGWGLWKGWKVLGSEFRSDQRAA